MWAGQTKFPGPVWQASQTLEAWTDPMVHSMYTVLKLVSKQVNTAFAHMRLYVARSEQECKSELIVGACLERVR